MTKFHVRCFPRYDVDDDFYQLYQNQSHFAGQEIDQELWVSENSYQARCKHLMDATLHPTQVGSVLTVSCDSDDLDNWSEIIWELTICVTSLPKNKCLMILIK